jgi:hypothetical protein
MERICTHTLIRSPSTASTRPASSLATGIHSAWEADGEREWIPSVEELEAGIPMRFTWEIVVAMLGFSGPTAGAADTASKQGLNPICRAMSLPD